MVRHQIAVHGRTAVQRRTRRIGHVNQRGGRLGIVARRTIRQDGGVSIEGVCGHVGQIARYHGAGVSRGSAQMVGGGRIGLHGCDGVGSCGRLQLRHLQQSRRGLTTRSVRPMTFGQCARVAHHVSLKIAWNETNPVDSQSSRHAHTQNE